MNVKDHILLWDHASIKVLDVRHRIMKMGESLRSYKMPSNGFIFITRGQAQVQFDNIEYIIQQFQVLHSGKGTILDILLTEDELEYYLIFYKASIPSSSHQEILRLLERSNPFHLQYSFVPSYPISIFHRVKLMEQEWNRADVLDRFYVKALFYQFIHSILRQLHRQGIDIIEPDLVVQVVMYIQDHYAQSITLESISATLNYSVPHVSSLFKKKTGYSVIDYLIRTRLDIAANLLVETDATLKEIALSIGYKDPYYFSRLFKKYKGVSPLRFRKREVSRLKEVDSPQNAIGSSIVWRQIWRYIDSDNHYQYKGEEDLIMFKGRKASLLASLLLCFTLLLSGCSMESSTNTSATTQGQSATTTVETYTYKGANGEVKIPKNPQRIIVVANNHVGYLLALGIKPVGMSDRALSNPFFEGKIEGIESYGDSTSLERILDMKPDLIFTLDNMENLDKIEKIAPTVAIKYGEKDFREQLLEYGQILGKDKEAQDWITNWDKKIAKYKTIIQEIVGDQKVAILGGTAKSMGAFGDFYGRGGEIIYKEFELKAPDIIQQRAIDSKEGYYTLSFEKLPEYAGDYLFISESLEQEIKENELWKHLPVVKNNRVFSIDENAYYFNDPTSLEKQLEMIVENIKTTQ